MIGAAGLLRTLAAFALLVTGLAGPARPRDLDPGVPRAMAGSWLIASQDGGPGCRVTLTTDRVPGGGESCAVRVDRRGCQSAVARLRLASWRMEMLKLVLHGLDGNSLGFVQTSSGFAEAPEEGGRPLVMERAPR